MLRDPEVPSPGCWLSSSPRPRGSEQFACLGLWFSFLPSPPPLLFLCRGGCFSPPRVAAGLWPIASALSPSLSPDAHRWEKGCVLTGLGGSPTACPHHGAAAPNYMGRCLPAARPPSHLSSPPHRARPCRMEVRLLLTSSPGEGKAPLGPAPPAQMGLWVLVWGTQSPVAAGGGCLFAKSCLASGRTRRAESLAEQRAASSAGGGALGCCPPPAGSTRRPLLCAPSSSGPWSPLSPVRPEQELAGRGDFPLLGGGLCLNALISAPLGFL